MSDLWDWDGVKEHNQHGIATITIPRAQYEALMAAAIAAETRIRELEAERDAIKAKTIDECEEALRIAHRKNGYLPLTVAIETICALAQTEKQ